jgi:parvulin-like peptidyl-prolyl isomerase
MKKLTVILAAAVLVATACSSKKEPDFKAAPGSSAYVLAKDAAKVLPALDPDKNTLLVRSKLFDVTTTEIVQMFLDSMGNDAQKLKDLDLPRIKSIMENAGRQLGERKLLVQAAAKAGKSGSPEDLKKALEAQYARAGGENQYVELLKSKGMSLDFVKKGIGEDLAIQKYIEGVVASVPPPAEAELRKIYQEDKTATVRHILLLTQGKTDREKAAVRVRMEEILARARKGEDFAALARETTEDQQSKESGGLYDDFPRGQMVKPFEDAAFSVPVGQISGIIETPYGYHILKVEERKKETRPFEEVKAELEAQVKQSSQRSILEAHVTALKKKADFQTVAI